MFEFLTQSPLLQALFGGAAPQAARGASRRPTPAGRTATDEQLGGGQPDALSSLFSGLLDASPPAEESASGHPGVNPILWDILDDPGAKSHASQVSSALEMLVAENEMRGLGNAGAMSIDDRPTTVEGFIIGNGATGTLDAATNPLHDKLALDTGQRLAHGTSRRAETGADLSADGHHGGLKGMAVDPGKLQADATERLTEDELALAMEETKRRSGVPFVKGTPEGPIELRPKHDEDWPPGAKAKVHVNMLDPLGKEHIETVFTTEVMDVATGIGATKHFSHDQIGNSFNQIRLQSWGPERPDGTRASPHLMYAEKFLTEKTVDKGQDVLVLGNDATSELCAQSAESQGAGHVTLQARAARPPSEAPDPENPGQMIKTPFGLCEDQLKEAAKHGEPIPETLRLQYKLHMGVHHMKLKMEVDALDQQIATLGADSDDAARHAGEIRRLTEMRDHKQDDLVPHRESGPDAEKGEAITQGEVISVKPSADGRVKVTSILPDGSVAVRFVDKVVGSLGADENDKTSPQKLCADVHEMQVIWGGDPPHPVGLQSVPAGVRVLGASAWAVQDKIKDPEERMRYRDAILARSEEVVSGSSRGVPFGLEAAGDNAALANEKLAKETADHLAKEATAGNPSPALDSAPPHAPPAPDPAELLWKDWISEGAAAR